MRNRPSFVVTGGARGIGRAIAARLTDDGQVVILDVTGATDWQHDRVTLMDRPESAPMPSRWVR